MHRLWKLSVALSAELERVDLEPPRVFVDHASPIAFILSDFIHLVTRPAWR